MSNTSVLLTCASVLDRLSSWCEVQDLSWLDLKSLQSLDNLGEFIFQWLGSLVSFHVGFVFLACQYYQDLIWFCKSESERWIILDTFRPFMMKLCFCNRSDTFLQLLPLCSCGPSGSTWAHMTRGRGVLFFCPRGGTSPVQWWATYLWKVCEEKGQNCQPVSSCTQYMGNGLHPSWSTRILDKKN